MTGVARPRSTRPRIGRSSRAALLLLTAAFAVDAGALAAVPLAAYAGVGSSRPVAAGQHRAVAGAASEADAAAARAARGATSLQDPSQPAVPTRSTATPDRIVIPSIDVDAAVQRLSRDGRGVLQPPDSWTEAGWYAKGPVPGDIGAAVIAGHLDTTKRAAVFVALRFLRPGDDVQVHLSNGRTLHFRVDRLRVVQKALFPSALVYGATPDAQLRLITCSEPFDEVHGVYADNLVVFATLRT